jgi:hypothetical protein
MNHDNLLGEGVMEQVTYESQLALFLRRRKRAY